SCVATRDRYGATTSSGVSRPAGLALASELQVLMKYKVALRHDEEGYSVSVPGLPGCWSQSATETEAIANIADAIKEYLAARDDLIGGGEVKEIEVAVEYVGKIPG